LLRGQESSVLKTFDAGHPLPGCDILFCRLARKGALAILSPVNSGAPAILSPVNSGTPAILSPVYLK
jgi:hypothetical protein